MDQKKIERIVKGITKSQQQEARRIIGLSENDRAQRATKNLCVVPQMPVLDRTTDEKRTDQGDQTQFA